MYKKHIIYLVINHENTHEGISSVQYEFYNYTSLLRTIFCLYKLQKTFSIQNQKKICLKWDNIIFPQLKAARG